MTATETLVSWLKTLVSVLAWPWVQLYRGAANFWRWVSQRLSVKDLLFPWVYETLVWIWRQLPMALGFGSPGNMVEASFVLAAASFFSGFVTGFASWSLIVVFAITGLIGLLRFIPAINVRWPLRDSSVPNAGLLSKGGVLA